ncbi:MAG: cation:proton antiporter [Prevotellaceae bacterium]|nr:cation:proton antiporter [Candidatus Faecinaster equi]
MDFCFSNYFPITDPTWIFIVVLCIILFAPLIFGRIHVPPLVGMVIAGAIIGPLGLNVIVSHGSFELFGQIGLYYIMFLAGLSMDINAMKSNKGEVLSFGLISFTIPLIIGGLTAYYILQFNILASILIACILSSHTLVTFPIVSRYGLNGHKSVTLSVVATMISLFLALIVLSGFTNSSSNSNNWIQWLMLLSKCILLGLMVIFLYPRLIRWFFRTFADDVLQYIFVMIVVSLTAAISKWFGLEGVLGAFLAGLVFNRYIPEAAPLMKHIEFLGNVLFIPFFLISVGMMIDIKLLFTSSYLLTLIGVIVLAALLSKYFAVFITSKIFRYNNDMQLMMTGLTSAHAAGALAMLMVGKQIEIAPGIPLIDETLINTVVMLILFSCIFSAYLTSIAAKRITLKNVSEEEKKGIEDKMLVALSSRPELMTNLVNMSLYMRPHKSNVPLVGIRLIVDANDNERELTAARQIVYEAAKLAAAAGVNMKKIVRSGVNIITGLTYTMKDFETSELMVGYPLQKNEGEGSLGYTLNELIARISRQIIVVSCLRPANTLRCIHAVIPNKADVEIGYYLWLSHLCRLARQLDCKIIFYCNDKIWESIDKFKNQKYSSIKASHITFENYSQMDSLKDKINDDHMFVMIAARVGSFSYLPCMSRLAEIVKQNFSHCSAMIIYPDQYGVEVMNTSFDIGFPHQQNN